MVVTVDESCQRQGIAAQAVLDLCFHRTQRVEIDEERGNGDGREEEGADRDRLDDRPDAVFLSLEVWLRTNDDVGRIVGHYCSVGGGPVGRMGFSA